MIGRVADPAGRLAGHPAGRGGGGEVAAAVAGDGAHGAVLRRLAIRMFERALQFPPACFAVKIAGLAECDAFARQKASAPSPISSTWRDRSITARAARTGLRGPKTPATAPARRSVPSMTQASISCVPAAVNTLPRPALNNGSSSSAATASVTASSALPPAARMSRPAVNARRKPSWYDAARETACLVSRDRSRPAVNGEREAGSGQSFRLRHSGMIHGTAPNIAPRAPMTSRQVLRLVLVGLGTSVVPLDTAVNIAFPEITGSFGLPVEMIQWVVICYVLTYSSLMLAFGRVGDIWGHGRVFRIGLLWSSVAYLLCAAAPNFGWLLFCRFLQGIGASLIVSCAPALVTGMFPEERRSRAVGMFTLMYAIGSAAGPLLGGVLVQFWGWPAVFWFRAPLALIALLFPAETHDDVSASSAGAGRHRRRRSARARHQHAFADPQPASAPARAGVSRGPATGDGR